ncbi:MAG: restriction endonuclease [Bacteroidota bacterium]
MDQQRIVSNIKEFHKRKITVLLVLLEKTNVPSDLLGFEYINLTGNFESGIDKIVKKLKVIPEITFDTFDPLQFENLVADLLKEYNFKNIERSGSTQDSGIDIIAGYESKNPFGTSYLESWIVQVKFYKQDRFSVSTLQQLISNKSKLSYSGATLLLVTNRYLRLQHRNFWRIRKN